MEITRTNFKSCIPDIKSAISNASFVAVDCEFSGLNIDSKANINPYDSYEEYYNKLKRSVNEFLVLQFGLCAFRYDTTDKKFKQKCFNFYLFPRPINKSIPDQRFVCQASSIDFLASHDFNFNKVFKEGISYLNQTDEEKFKNFLEEKHKERQSNVTNDNGTIPVPDEDREFVHQTMVLIKSFLSNGQNELMLPQCNAFRRRLIYQTTRDTFGNLVTLETRALENKDRVLFVLKPESAEEKAQRDQERYEASLSELEDIVGFSRIIQHLSESRKLIVGHNLCLDLLHMINKFLTPLAEYDEFKECASALFPRILDTKYMASSGPFKDIINNTVLGAMINILNNKPFNIPEIDIDENGVGYSLKDDKEHESGYDAFLTGVCFLTMAKHIYKGDDLHKIIEVENSKPLKPFLNKIFLQRLQDGSCINLSGTDSKLNRDHVLHITFPKEWKLYDINQLFSPFGNINVSFLSDTTAYVALYRKNQTSQALNTLSQSNSYTVTSYAKHQARIKAKKRESDPAVLPERKKPRKDACFGESQDKSDEQPEDQWRSFFGSNGITASAFYSAFFYLFTILTFLYLASKLDDELLKELSFQ